MKLVDDKKGFGAVGVFGILLVIAVLSIGWYVWNTRNEGKLPNTTQPKTASPAPAVHTTADPYEGWKTYCDTENEKACFKYPSNWVPAQYGGFENTEETAYIHFEGYNNRDQDGGDVMIVRLVGPLRKDLGVTIVGKIYNDAPSYTMFNTSYLAEFKEGQTVQMVTGNPQFERIGGIVGTNMSFSASPNIEGMRSIKTFEQAKAWFDTPEAQTCLKILQSFYYQ